MKILFIHNEYRHHGGEDTVFNQETLLMKETESLRVLRFRNREGWRGAWQFLSSIWNLRSARKIDMAIKEFKPDIIHVHNWHYALGPLFIRRVFRRNLPLVQTIPNYRLVCPSATLLHNGSIFLESVKKEFPWRAVLNKVYRDSVLQTFWLAFIVWFHKKIGTWNMVSRYILLTEMAKDIFVSSSLHLPGAKLLVKPNFLKDPGQGSQQRQDFFLFIGRLSEEKGVSVLLKAFERNKFKLMVAGEGPLKDKVIDASRRNSSIHYLGRLDSKDVEEIMKRSEALIFPSIWYEGMPMTIIEAFATGTPVIASNLGAMASMIEDGFNGLHFASGNDEDLSEKLEKWKALDACTKARISKNAREEYERKYTPDRNKEQTLAIYRTLVRHH